MVHNGQEVELSRRQERRLLCILLLENTRLVPAYRLLDLLWHGNPPHSGRATLYTYVTRVRQSIAPYGISVLRKGDGYLINVDPASVDVHRFAAGLVSAQAESEAVKRLLILDRALELWRGPLMADIADDHLRQRLDNGLEARHVAALELQAKTRLELGLNDQAAQDLTRLVSRYPAQENAVELLMTALYRSGRKTEALEAFRDLRKRLADELGLDPAPRLHALHKSILNDEAASVAEPTVPRDLPANVSGFTGREAVLQELDSLLPQAGAANPATPVVISAIAGLPGVGKTALAVHWAHRVASHFPDGQLYVNLRGFSDGAPIKPAHVLTTLLGRLGVPPEGVPTDVGAAAAYFRSLLAGRRMLVILDNARSAGQVRPLLPGSPGCFVVVTSRDRLSSLVAREGVRRITLELLSEVDAVQLLVEMLGRERVMRERQAAVALVNLCGRLPLALRMAGARLADSPHQTIADHVAQMTAHTALACLVLDGGEGVGAAFELSYRALPESAQLVFRSMGRLNLYDYTADSVSALAGISSPQAVTALDRLAAAHLLDQHQPGRYGMHDLLWQYAHSISTESPEAVGRLYDSYLAKVSGAAGLLYPDTVRLENDLEPVTFDSKRSAISWFDAERANVASAIVHAARNGPYRLAWLLADGMLGYFDQHPTGGDRLASARAAVAAARVHGDAKAQAASYQVLAHAAIGPTRPERWVTYLTKAVASAAEAGWSLGEAAIRTILTLMFHLTGKMIDAEEQAKAAVTLHEQAGRPEARLWAMNLLVEIYGQLGRAKEGLDLAREAEGWLDDRSSRKARGRVLVAQAEMYHVLGEGRWAVDRATAALEHFRHLENRFFEAHTLIRLSEARLHNGELELARAAGTRALEMAETMGHAWLSADALNNISGVDLAQRDVELALRRRQDALQIAETIPFQHMLTATHVGLAEAHQMLGELEVATKYAERALSLSRQSGYSFLENRALALLSQDLAN